VTETTSFWTSPGDPPQTNGVGVSVNGTGLGVNVTGTGLGGKVTVSVGVFGVIVWVEALCALTGEQAESPMRSAMQVIRGFT
jgi:hypothetical protein